MAFDSFTAFILMDDHGPYVWVCYGVFVVLIAGMMLWSWRRHRAVLQACRRVHETTDESGRGSAQPAPATFTRVKVSQD